MTQGIYATDTPQAPAQSVVVGYVDTSTPPKFIPASVTNPIPVVMGAGGLGLADIALTDDNAVLFVGRDNGSAFSFVRITDGTAYVPVGTIKVASINGTFTSTQLATLITLNTALNAAVGSPLQAGGTVVVGGTVSVGASALPTGAALDSSLTTINTTLQQPSSQLPAALGLQATTGSVSTAVASDDVMVGARTETAPASDTASSGLNGRLQRIAQRLTSLIAQLPAALGITTAANSLSIAPASDAVFAIKGAPASGIVDRSGTITAGGVAQNIAGANAARAGYMVQNLSGTEDLWVSTVSTAVATQPSIRILPNAIWSPDLGSAGTGAISLLGATTGHVFTAREW